VFTKTSNDVSFIVDTREFFDSIDTMDLRLPKKCLLTISYSLEIVIPSSAENSNLFKAIFILCTLDPTSPDLLLGGVNCHPTGGGPFPGGVPFGNNFGLNTQRHHGAHSFTWGENVNAGLHKTFMRASYDSIWNGSPPSSPPTTIIHPKVLKRALVVQAFPN
jgi:hypothetical protein